MSATALIGSQETVALDAIMEIAFGFAASKTLFSAVELGLFTELKKVRQPRRTFNEGSDLPAVRPIFEDCVGKHGLQHRVEFDDERSHNTAGLLMSLNMLIETPAGFDYTGSQCREWMRQSGFRTSHVEHLTGSQSMVVGTK